MTFHVERMIQMSRKIITEITESALNEKTGEYEIKKSQQVAIIATEEKYYKFYHKGLVYISDMPAECHKVFYALLDNMTYVDDNVEGLDEYGMLIFLNVDVKRGIAKTLGYENHRSLDNVIQKLEKGNVLYRIGKGIYRPNPYIVARGAWKEIAHLRAKYGPPIADGDTFKTVCAKKDAVKKQLQESAPFSQRDN